MADAPRIMVTLPAPHDATSQMARILHEERLLGDYVVPLNVSGRRFPAAIESRLNIDQWRYPVPAVSGAPVRELAVAAAFRALSGHTAARGMQPMAAWRAGALDRFGARRLKAGEHTAVTALFRRTPRTIAMANRLGIPVVLFLNGDPWGMRHRLDAISSEAPDELTRREVIAELPSDAVPAGDRILRRAALIVVESTRMARQVNQRAPGTPVVVLGQGVDADYFVPAPRDYSARPLRIVQLSRVVHGKGVHVTSEAVRLASADVETCTLAGWSASDSPNLVRRSANITFKGGVPKAEVRDLLQRSDVFVLPTFADPMPRVVLEAMACGLPVITTADSGYDDVIEHGVNGFLVPLGNAAAVAALLTRLSRDGELRRRVGAAARATAEANSWDAFRERFRSKLYAEILPFLGAAAR